MKCRELMNYTLSSAALASLADTASAADAAQDAGRIHRMQLDRGFILALRNRAITLQVDTVFC
jgi:hypothetical protein